MGTKVARSLARAATASDGWNAFQVGRARRAAASSELRDAVSAHVAGMIGACDAAVDFTRSELREHLAKVGTVPAWVTLGSDVIASIEHASVRLAKLHSADVIARVVAGLWGIPFAPVADRIGPRTANRASIVAGRDADVPDGYQIDAGGTDDDADGSDATWLASFPATFVGRDDRDAYVATAHVIGGASVNAGAHGPSVVCRMVIREETASDVRHVDPSRIAHADLLRAAAKLAKLAATDGIMLIPSRIKVWASASGGWSSRADGWGWISWARASERSRRAKLDALAPVAPDRSGPATARRTGRTVMSDATMIERSRRSHVIVPASERRDRIVRALVKPVVGKPVARGRDRDVMMPSGPFAGFVGPMQPRVMVRQKPRTGRVIDRTPTVTSDGARQTRKLQRMAHAAFLASFVGPMLPPTKLDGAKRATGDALARQTWQHANDRAMAKRAVRVERDMLEHAGFLAHVR